MSVTQIKQAIGDWSLTLRAETPRDILDALTYYGHIAILPSSVAPALYGDNLLLGARYVGVYRGRSAEDEYQLNGGGMALWLGDEDDKGDIFETAVSFTGATFAATIAGLLPVGGSVTAGVIGAVAGTYTGKHQWQTPRQAIQYVTDTFGSPSAPVEWRVTNDGKLDAGLVSGMYVTSPRAILMRRSPGKDLLHVAIPGHMGFSQKIDDFTTRVVILAEGEGDAIAQGSANIAVNPYKDIHGNAVKLTRVTSESDTTAGNAAARAQLMLNRFSNPASAVELSTVDYDVHNDFVVGDYIYVYDPDNGFLDAANEEYWNGDRINPVKIRAVEISYPILAGWTIAFRDTNGNWLDLSPWYVPEDGDTTIVVGDLPSDLTGVGGGGVDVRPGIGADDTIPGVPTFTLPFDGVAYQSTDLSDVKAAVLVKWSQPLNVDASTIIDGDHYEIRYRAGQQYSYPVLWSQVMVEHWNELGTWGRPLSNPAAVADQWNYVNVGWDSNQFMINELMVATDYDFQIRAVDSANPPHAGAWSATTTYTTKNDVIAPEQPAPPTVHSSPIAIQVSHSLGAASGGTFNLASDLHHLEIHIGGGDFFPDVSTRVGQIIANEGNLIGQIPVVATFQTPFTEQMTVKVIAVDRFGNKSSASAGATATPDLIDDEFISSLTASKITAGTITSDVLLAGSIRTGETGQRVEMNNVGIILYDTSGDPVINLTTGFGNFLGIQDLDDNTVAAIDSMGNIQGQTVTASQDLILAGRSLTETLFDLPRGIVARGKSTWTTTTSGAGVELGHMELSFVAEAGRQYRVHLWAPDFNGSLDNDRARWNIRDGGESQPDLTSPILPGGSVLIRVRQVGTNLSAGVTTTFDLTPGLHRLLWSILADSGTTTISSPVGFEAQMWVEDMGDVVPDTGVQNTGVASGSGTTTPVTTYTSSYVATWSGTYDGSSHLVTYYGNEAHQGQYDSSVGNRRSLIGFNSAQIRSDLSGATINSVKVTLYAEHWYNNAGGTAVIGTHSYTSRPTSWSTSRVTENRQQSAGWPKPGKRTVTLSSGFGTDLKSGAATGIALGPGPSTSHEYYGRFTGYDGGANRPVLTIVYTK